MNFTTFGGNTFKNQTVYILTFSVIHISERKVVNK